MATPAMGSGYAAAGVPGSASRKARRELLPSTNQPFPTFSEIYLNAVKALLTTTTAATDGRPSPARRR